MKATLPILGLLTALAPGWEPPKDPVLVDPSVFVAPEGLEVTVWARSPQLFNPTNLDIDAQGRIWVAEGVNYRSHANRRPEGDRIVVLEDTNGDGQADASHTFVQEKGLVAPLGVAVFDNRVVVSQPPDLIVYTDVDRDAIFNPDVDTREVLLTGFNARNHDHSLHSVVGGPDGKWYINNGNCGSEFTDKSGKTFRIAGDYFRDGGGDWFVDNPSIAGKPSDDGNVWVGGFTARMNPDGSQVEVVGHGYRNSFENCVNSFGEVFQTDNDDPPACRTSYVLEGGCAGYFTPEGHFYGSVKRPGQEHWRNHWRQDDPGTFDAGDVYGGGSPTGIVFYENGALGPGRRGTLLAGEPARNVIFGYQPEPKGATYQLDRTDWLTSNTTGVFDGADFTGGAREVTQVEHADARLFRPSDVAVGPDGAIYVTDWFDPRVGGHGDMDESCSGAIYRIAPKNFQPKVPKIDLTTLEGAIAALRSPAVNVRWTGFAALQSRGTSALPAVLSLLEDPNPWIAARGIWLLPYLGEDGIAKCRALLTSDQVRERLVAFRALDRAGLDILEAARGLASDPSPAVRRDVALAMRDVPATTSAPILLDVAKGWDGLDKNYLESIGLGATHQENLIWPVLRDALSPGSPLQWTDAFARLTWRLWPEPAIADLKIRALSSELTQEQREFATESLSFIQAPAAADAMFDLAKDDSPVKAAAVSWLFMRGTGAWDSFHLRGRLKETGIYDPDAIVLSESIVPGKPATTKFSEEEVLKLHGDSSRGQAQAMRCTMCHHINGVGPHYGPDLRGWVGRQGVETAVHAIVDPSADIAHGFDGTAIELKDGRWIDGRIQSDGDPIVSTSTGGVTQLIPRDRVASRHSMERSLMLNADQLGLTAQDVADIVAWLGTYQ
ncbi:putative membrane-bound dehydrogenase-like protein [Haloferula luteola]|uniref:Putative membrane-bound dehydrogenase-like protein n=1 Tax=Haloferula luteola TaxID=595692 RepID=A0A840VDL3_9BACT|nr:PVC-type heme-binding CxxCH protein [Haloferula luteola]MBB5351970.1 putative membrane-bound dehydrogenase-like protein [Haloferula luteola]